MLEEVSKNQIDLIVLPEMALIGYKFTNREDILPHCEEIAKKCSEATSEMPTLQLCISISERYSAWVACGLAEICDGVLYNS